ncbi:MAG: group II intron reverse transcriptase/maturase [Polyangiaceae bacterium]|nr:group II intron reverse transcriptase/maturase [Polyangiaceae bacterium]
MTETPSLTTISTKLERIAKQAHQAPDMAFTTLAHHIDLEWLREAYRRTRKDGAVGVDGQSAKEYAENLEGNLRSLLDRAKSGAYRAPPVLRVHIPKGDGKETRPLGIPTFEDKVLQRAVAMVLEAIYEQDFLDCKFGFRPRRSARQALEVLRTPAVIMAGGWVVELDIRKYFDTLDHERLREVLRRRVRDGVILRLIGKWLNAGVLEDGELSFPDAGTPQGGVISPLLANVYLHEVLDVWFEREVRPRLRGRAHLVRYADDAALLFEYEEDARRVLEVLPKRFEKYGLALHPDKTRLVPFKRSDRIRPGSRDDGRGPKGPGTFNFLGFTFHWGKSLAGKWVVRMRTAKDRYRRALGAITQWCRLHRHKPIREQQRALAAKLSGHYGYYGRTGNFGRLWCFYWHVTCLWRRWLSRRSDKAYLDWAAMNRLLERYPLPKPSVVRARLAANP